jgi:hypothetical protein
MPRNAFPLSKSKGYALGVDWNWCVHRLRSQAGVFKLLIAFHPGKEEYRAWLAIEDRTDAALLARLEYHSTLHGWHIHVRTSQLSDVARGVVKESRARERRRDCTRSNPTFGISKLDAVSLAFRVFNVEPNVSEGLLL